MLYHYCLIIASQLVLTFLNSKMETAEQSVQSFQTVKINNKDIRTTSISFWYLYFKL